MSALDPTIADLLGGGQTETIETQPEPEVVDTTVDDSGATEVQPEEVEVDDQPDTVHIEGFGDYTLDELKEFKNGYLRQSDYTRKTQELARQ